MTPCWGGLTPCLDSLMPCWGGLRPCWGGLTLCWGGLIFLDVQRRGDLFLFCTLWTKPLLRCYRSRSSFISDSFCVVCHRRCSCSHRQRCMKTGHWSIWHLMWTFSFVWASNSIRLHSWKGQTFKWWFFYVCCWRHWSLRVCRLGIRGDEIVL